MVPGRIAGISRSMLNAADHRPTLRSSIPQTNMLLYNSRAMSNPVLKVVPHESSTAAFSIFLNLKKKPKTKNQTNPKQQKTAAANVNFKCPKADIPAAEGTLAASAPGFNHITP